MNNLESDYFYWLVDKVCRDSRMHYMNYLNLLYYLYETPFIYILEMDRYRSQGGVNLRYEFAIEKRIDLEDMSDLINKHCSVLEMMISLATSISNLLEDMFDDNSVGKWFWEMASNLGLDIYTNTTYRLEEVSKIVDDMMMRRYSPDGNGSMFPIPGIDRDMRNVELWYQMMWYLRKECGPESMAN